MSWSTVCEVTNAERSVTFVGISYQRPFPGMTGFACFFPGISASAAARNVDWSPTSSTNPVGSKLTAGSMSLGSNRKSSSKIRKSVSLSHILFTIKGKAWSWRVDN